MIPEPSADQLLPFHLAIPLAGLPPAVAKTPPAYKSLPDTASADTTGPPGSPPPTPEPIADQLHPSPHPSPSSCYPPTYQYTYPRRRPPPRNNPPHTARRPTPPAPTRRRSSSPNRAPTNCSRSISRSHWPGCRPPS